MSNLIDLTKKLFAVTILLMVGLCAVANGAAMYNVTEIKDLSWGGDIANIGSIDINNSGQLVGILASNYNAGLWENGTITNLGSLGGVFSEAMGINNHGQVVGRSQNAEGNNRAFLWENGVMTDLGTLGGSTSYAYSINDSAQVTGWSQNTEGKTRAFLWENGVMTDLGAFNNSHSYGYSINNSGEIVGWSYTDGTAKSAFRWKDGTMTALGSLYSYGSKAYSNNDSGWIVGSTSGVNAPHFPRALLWEPDGSVSDMSISAEGRWGMDINNYGQAIGYTAEYTGALWTNKDGYLWENGNTTWLSTLVDPSSMWTQMTPYAINDSGWIVGHGQNNQGEWTTFLLTPVPEPSVLILCIGLLCMLPGKGRLSK
jgi:probable HAF family extracellular repeat protein